MTLKELGYEYLAQEKALRARLRELKKSGQPDSPLLRRRMYYLYLEATDCHKIGMHLVNYYKEGEV